MEKINQIEKYIKIHEYSKILQLISSTPILLQHDTLLHTILSIHSIQVLSLLKSLLDQNCKLNGKNSLGETPLHIACKTNNLVIVEMIIEKSKTSSENLKSLLKININERDNNGMTPLHVAAKSSCSEPSIVKYLIENGASIVSVDNKNNTPFIYAEINNHFAKAQLLNIDEEPETNENHTYDEYDFELRIIQQQRKEKHAENVKWGSIISSFSDCTGKDEKWIKKHLGSLSPSIRGKIWECFTQTTSPTREKHEEYVKLFIEGNKNIDQELLKTVRMYLNVFPDHKVFIQGRGRYKLERLLVCFLYDEMTNYSLQQMNAIDLSSLAKIAGLLLCILGEELAFFVLRAMHNSKYGIQHILDTQLPEAFCIFPVIFKMEIPQVFEKLSSVGVDARFFVTWFADLFIDVFPIRLTIAIWDYYFLNGKNVLYTVTINFLKYIKQDLLKCNSIDEVHKIIEQKCAELNETSVGILFKEKIDKSQIETLRTKYINDWNNQWDQK